MTEEKVTFAYFEVDVPKEALSKAYPHLHHLLHDDEDGFFKKTESPKGYACVSLKRPPKGSNSTEFNAGVSFCSPLDAHNGIINKKKARLIAEGRRRCMRPGRRLELSITDLKEKKIRDIQLEALAKALDEHTTMLKRGDAVTYAPRWAKEAIKLGKEFKFKEKGPNGSGSKKEGNN